MRYIATTAEAYSIDSWHHIGMIKNRSGELEYCHIIQRTSYYTLVHHIPISGNRSADVANKTENSTHNFWRIRKHEKQQSQQAMVQNKGCVWESEERGNNRQQPLKL